MQYYSLIKKEFERLCLNVPTEECWKSDPLLYIRMLKFVPDFGHPLRNKAVGSVHQTMARNPEDIRSWIVQGLCEIVPSPYVGVIQKIAFLFEALPDNLELTENETSNLLAAVSQHVQSRRTNDIELWARIEKKITDILTGIKERLPREADAGTNEMPVIKKSIFQGVLCRVRESLS